MRARYFHAEQLKLALMRAIPVNKKSKAPPKRRCLVALSKFVCYCWLVGGGVELAPPLVLPPVQLSEIMSTLVTLKDRKSVV